MPIKLRLICRIPKSVAHMLDDEQENVTTAETIDHV